MAQLPGAFNANDHKDMGFEPIPKENYVFRVTESAYKENSKKTGHNLSLKLVVQEGEYAGRIIYRNLCLTHENQTTVDIAQRELATICRACGLPNGIDDSEELHGIDFGASVAVQSGKGDNPDQNIITKYFPLEGAERPAAAVAKSTGTSSGSKKPVFEDEEEPEAKPTTGKKKPVFEDDED